MNLLHFDDYENTPATLEGTHTHRYIYIYIYRHGIQRGTEAPILSM